MCGLQKVCYVVRVMQGSNEVLNLSGIITFLLPRNKCIGPFYFIQKNKRKNHSVYPIASQRLILSQLWLILI